MELGLEFDSPQNEIYQEYQTPQNDDPFAEDQSIRVILRIRPLSERELTRRDTISINPVSTNTCIVNKKQIFFSNSKIQNGHQVPPTQLQFDAVFDSQASQEEIYKNSGIDTLIKKAIEGYSVTVFAYGQTGSGKTFTITGPDTHKNSIDPYHPEAGLVSCALLTLQTHLQKLTENNNENFQISMKASYYEIYNEHVKDLLRPVNTSLQVRWSIETGFFVENLFMVECQVLDDFVCVLEEGLRNRKTGSHNLNTHSSRSHSIMTVYISTLDGNHLDAKGCAVERVGQISFVDLAGNYFYC